VRILGIGPRLYLGDIYLSLQREGHDVKAFSEHPDPAFAGLLAPIPDWRAALPWVGHDGIILFESLNHGATQDTLRAEGYRVVGGSALGDRLEQDRAFGQAALRDAGLPIAGSHAFDTAAAALAWLARHPGRYVLKHGHPDYPTFVGDHPSGADLAFMLARRPIGPVLLMERLEGVEVGIGAFFNGREFLHPPCIDFEHKRFFPGEMGEMTGEMGTLASYEHSLPLFGATLARLAPLFASANHVGYVNLNLIVNARGIWPLEFTCRFGNPGFAVLAALQPPWGALLDAVATRATTFDAKPGWSIAIVLTIPPFPARLDSATPADDAPLFFLHPPDLDHHHFIDMRRDGGQLLVHRRSGHAMIVTGIGPTVPAAQAAARRRAANVVAPELRYRTDIGDRFLAADAARLQSWGWL